MPIYEFRCLDCYQKFAVLVGMTLDSGNDPCPKCGSMKAERLMSKFVRGRGEDDRIDEVTERLSMMGEPESGIAIRGMVREMGKAVDDDMSDEMEEIYEMDAEGKLDDEE